MALLAVLLAYTYADALARFSTPVLRDLDARAEFRGQAARSLAVGWLRAQALIPGG